MERSLLLTQRWSLVELPVEERRQVLARQAEEMKGHYEKTRADRNGEQGGAVYDYDTGEGIGG